MSIINGLSLVSLASKVVRGVAEATGDFASMLANATTSSNGSTTTTSGTSSEAGQGVASSGSASQGGGSTLDDFLAYMKLSPGDKLRYGVMKDMGVTQQQLDAMPADEKDKIEKEIAERIKEKLTQQVASGGNPTQTNANLQALKQVQASAATASPALDLFG